MLVDRVYLTIPDEIDLTFNSSKEKMTKAMFMFIFFLFRWFIVEEYIMNLKDNFLVICHYNDFLKQTLFKSKFHILNKNFYLKLYLYYKYKVFEYLKIKFLTSFYSLENKVFIFFYLLRKGKFLLNFDYFFCKKEIEIFFLSDFKLRLPFFLFTAFPDYMDFFRFYKYNEYLSFHPALYNYPLLKFLLRVDWKDGKYKKGSLFYNQHATTSSFIIYLSNEEEDLEFISFFNFNWINILLCLDKFKFIKLGSIFNKKIYIFLFNYFKIYFLNIFFLFIYNF
jgi:hypothetical protein